MNSKTIFLHLTLLSFICLLPACTKNKSQQPLSPLQEYAVKESKILHRGQPIQLIGANAFHVFSAGSSDMNSWHLDIAREFIGNVSETPLSGTPIQARNGAYLYSLQTIVDSNRLNKRITVLCPFGWDGNDSTAFTSKRPTQTVWWNAYKTKLQQWATQFKDQPDVWLEVWNEPYNYTQTDGYTDEVWAQDMNELVAVIREAGNTNIVLVPCAAQGQDESVLLNKGISFLAGKANILFDVHAYERWLLDDNAHMASRLDQLAAKQLPVFFGETAPVNSGVLMNPEPFLDSAYTRGLSVCAWAWKYDASDRDALLTTDGQPNNTNNNNWGSLFKSLAARDRKP